jgi:O-antigen ligase
LLLVLNIVGYIFTADFENEYHVHMFKGILLCMLPFYPFYYFAQTGELKAHHLLRFFVIMLPIKIVLFYNNQSNILLENDPEVTNVVNNVAFSFVRLLPFVFLIKKYKIISIALIMLFLFFIIQGAKRGAMIVGGLGMILYFIFQIFSLEKERRVQGYLIAIICFLLIGFFAYKMYLENEFLIARMNAMAEGNSSGRDEIFNKVFDSWYDEESLKVFLLGFGFAGSVKLAGNYAHNDWLELLSNFGILGVTIYLVLFYSIAKQLLDRNWRIEKKILLFTITLMWFTTTMFSMWYSTAQGYSQAILLAYLIGSEGDSLV